jgi:hypothetical protein
MSLSVDSIKKISKPLLFSFAVTGISMLGGIAVISLLILPVRARSVTVRSEVAALEATQAKMKADIKCMAEVTKRTALSRAELEQLLKTGTLKPEELSNSMRMGARSLLMPLAQKTDFKLENVKESPSILLRLPTPPPNTIYARQPIECIGQGSYQEILSFVQETEETYPLTILSGLVILSQPQTPECHKAVITFEWPVKHEWLQAGPAGQK